MQALILPIEAIWRLRPSPMLERLQRTQILRGCRQRSSDRLSREEFIRKVMSGSHSGDYDGNPPPPIRVDIGA